jgi:hypothetical protein
MRTAPLAISRDDFRRIGHELVDRIAGHLATFVVQRTSAVSWLHHLESGAVGDCRAHRISRRVWRTAVSGGNFRYVPSDLRSRLGSADVETYLNQLNQELLTGVEKSGEAFLSNALIGNVFALRACIVNFHTSIEDVEWLPGLLSRMGKEADQTLRTVRT